MLWIFCCDSYCCSLIIFSSFYILRYSFQLSFSLSSNFQVSSFIFVDSLGPASSSCKSSLSSLSLLRPTSAWDLFLFYNCRSSGSGLYLGPCSAQQASYFWNSSFWCVSCRFSAFMFSTSTCYFSSSTTSCRCSCCLLGGALNSDCIQPAQFSQSSSGSLGSYLSVKTTWLLAHCRMSKTFWSVTTFFEKEGSPVDFSVTLFSCCWKSENLMRNPEVLGLVGDTFFSVEPDTSSSLMSSLFSSFKQFWSRMPHCFPMISPDLFSRISRSKV